MMFLSFANACALPTAPNPFPYDLGVRIIGDVSKKSELTLCCHGYGHSAQIVELIHALDVFDHALVGFNFPDYDITDERDHTKASYGTINEILPLLHLLNYYACECGIPTVNLYGFSAGGGAIINALAVLHNYEQEKHLAQLGITPENAQKIITALSRGIIVLECPLKSMQEIIDFRGKSKNLLLVASKYTKNTMNPIDTLTRIENMNLTIILHFVRPDDILSNRDDTLFIGRLKKANQGITYTTIGSRGSHNGYHAELWDCYRKIRVQ
jgi:hypothetical protein